MISELLPASGWLVAFGAALLTLLISGVVAIAYGRRRFLAGRSSRDAELEQLAQRTDELRAHLSEQQARAQQEAQRMRALEQAVNLAAREQGELRGRLAGMAQLERLGQQRDAELAQTRGKLQVALTEASVLQSRLSNEVVQSAERLAFLERVRGEFSDAFKTLANDVLDDKSRRLNAENVSQMGTLLNPVREQLKSFQEIVQQAYVSEARERSVLGREIESLKVLNHQLNAEAANLSRALRGDNQVQGAWGELILERLLEACGLTEGREYFSQIVLKDEGGGRPRPDVIVRLPQSRDLVIDSKVALVAYERALHAADDGERQTAVDEHVRSMRRHVDGLSRRDYTSILDGRTLDLVLMFVPVESALMEAVRADGGLYEYALERNIAIVSPSNLLVTLRAVAHLWKQEQRNNNAQDIAKRAGRLYDKFVSFVNDLESARAALSKAQRELEQAFGKLRSGPGNLVRQTEQLRELGARNQKQLSADVLGEAMEWGDGDAARQTDLRSGGEVAVTPSGQGGATDFVWPSAPT